MGDDGRQAGPMTGGNGGSRQAPHTPAPDDSVLPFRIERTGLHGRLVRLGGVVDEILSRHDYPEPVAALLGEALALTCALGASLKFDGVFTLQTKSDGPVRILVADVTSDGGLRGYAEVDAARLREVEEGEPEADPVGKLLGDGYLAFTVDQGSYTDRYQGVVELSGSTLAECALHYLRQSEQLETILNLGVGRSEGAWRAYGLMIQKPPRTDADGRNAWDMSGLEEEAGEDDWVHTATLASTLGEAEGLDSSLGAEDLLLRLFHEDGVRVMDARDVRFRCRCSRRRVADTLRMIGPDELESMKIDDKVVVTCQFCNTAYSFDEAQLEEVFAQRGANGGG